MERQLPVQVGDELFTEHLTITEAGDFQLYWQPAAPHHSQQPHKEGAARIVIDFDDHFNLAKIETTYRHNVYDLAGNVILQYMDDKPHVANLSDRRGFAKMFGPGIAGSISNGWKRGAKKDNRRPIYGLDGQPISYTAEQLAEPMISDYETHNADGTRADGAAV